MKIAVDLGNRNVCICCKMKDKLKLDSFQARFSTEIQQDYTGSEVLEFDGVKYCIEQGEYDFEFNKSCKKYLPLLLCAISRMTKDTTIELMIGAPVEHVLGLRDELKKQLTGQTFEFVYNGNKRKITIERVGVIGEGLSTYFTIDKTLRSSLKNIGICDIGGRTVNVVTFLNGKQDSILSINEGILDVKNRILTKEKEKGKDYNIITIENLIDNKRLAIADEYKTKLIDKIINDMKSKKINVDMYTWFVTGGGSLDIGADLLDEVFGDNCIVEDALYSNVQGNYRFMEAKWGE